MTDTQQQQPLNNGLNLKRHIKNAAGHDLSLSTNINY